jgi:1,4-alpha-glucan branching enzyme
LHIHARSGEHIDRLSPWAKRVVQQGQPLYESVYWDPPQSDLHVWRNCAPLLSHDSGLKVYEAHIGMSSSEPRIATYTEFADKVLPMVAALGYNSIQLMGIMEHAYYASFGYQV